MALQYLLAPTFQFVNTAGKPLSGGAYMEVYVHGTRTKYYCASDFNGTLHPFRIPLDSLGSNIVLANDTGSYDVYAYNRYGTLLMSRYNVKPGAGGGMGGTITSSDGSIEVLPTEDGVDLSVKGLDPSCLKASADPRATDGKFHFDTLVKEGEQVYIDNEGAIRMLKGWYHFTAIVQLAWEAGARNESHQITLYTTLSNSVIDFDISHVHTETLELSGDVSIASDGAELVIGISGMPTGLEARIIDMDVHAITGKDGFTKYHAGTGITISDENYIAADLDVVQEKLVAGTGIDITGNVISAPTHQQLNADWDATSGVQEILNKPDLGVYATNAALSYGLAQKQDTISDLAAIRSGAQAGASAVQPADLANVATTGNYNDLNNRPNLTVYATTADMNTALATKQDVINDLSTIRSGAAAGATAVQPSDLATVATTGAYSDLSGKPDLSIYAQSADLAAVATSGDYDDLSDKPDLSVYATTQAMNTALAGKQDTISDLSTIRSGAEAGASAVQPSDLATVATTGSYNDLEDKPTIPAAQVNSDWDATSGVAAILNRPNLATVATTGDYSDLTNKPSIPAAQVNADWDATSGIERILNRPNLATVATTGDYNDLVNTPVIPTVMVADVEVDGTSVVNAQGVAEITMPTVPTKTSDLQNDSGFITLADVPAQENADWDATSGASEILHKPDLSIYAQSSSLATVATTGDYDDLTDKPDLSVFAESADLATVATTGDYDDLTNKPTIPAAQVNADWDATSGVEQILNRPSLATVATTGDYADLSNKPNLATVATTGAYSDLSGTPTINNVPAVTSSDNDKVLKASYSGGVGSYSWQTEQGGGSTYTAGDAIDITNDEISVLYDSDTLELKPTSVTYTYELGTWYENYGRAYVEVDSNVKYVLEYAPDRMLTIHIPGNTFSIHDEKTLYLKFSSDQYFNRTGNYLAPVLSTTYDSGTSTTWVDEQDIVVSSGYYINPDPDYWHLDQYGTEAANYIGIGIADGNDFCSITSAAAGAGVTMSFTAATGDPELAVKNPLPASASGDANKVLTVDSQGVPGWATAQGTTYSAGNGITISSNTVSAKVDGTTIGTNASGELESLVTQAQADWAESDSSDPSYIENKPVPKTLTAGTGISISESSSTITIAATPVSEETVLYSNANGSTTPSLNEALTNFARCRVVYQGGAAIPIETSFDVVSGQSAYNLVGVYFRSDSQNFVQFQCTTMTLSNNDETATFSNGSRLWLPGNDSDTQTILCTKIVGIHRIASN